ncbi:MAG TPA: hypothetical protein VG206_02060 [Terriglobia bacterium]|nr:hypothetical protein [Terriglobia bacterium]
MRGQRTFFILALIMFGVAVLRWFMKGWMDSLGLPELLGSFLSSITIVALVGLVVFFASEGRSPQPRYWRAGTWWIALAAWSQILVIAGILLAARTGASTYYSEMVAAHRELPPVQHALSHAAAFVFVGGVGLLLGWLVYWVAKRGRQPQIVRPARS